MHFISFIKKYRVPIILLLICLEALFLRIYNLSDWLHFQLDQARDAILIKDVLEKGISELPLLGPRAADSYLRLGPFYYYLLYFSAAIARNTSPVVFVIPVIIGNLALIPFLYLLFRKVLNANWSLLYTFLAANSVFLVTYSRFAWNPNLLSLFSAISIIIFLKYLEATRKDFRRKAKIWAFWGGISIGLFIQFHFIAFFVMPVVILTVLGLFWLKEYFHEKHLPELKKAFVEIVLFVSAFLLTQIPVLANEYVSSGMNAKQFFSSIGTKKDTDKTNNTKEKIIQNLWVYPKGFLVLTTGFEKIDYPKWYIRPDLNIVCDEECKNNLIFTITGSIFVIFVIYILLRYFYLASRKIFISREKIKKISPTIHSHWELIVLILIWVVIPWWAFYFLSFNLKPRFFLFSIVPFWLIIAFFHRYLIKVKGGIYMAGVFCLFILISNFYSLFVRFDNVKGADVIEKSAYPQNLIFPVEEDYPVTLRQQKKIVTWLHGRYSKESQEKEYLFFWSPPSFYRPIMYLFSEMGFSDNTNYFTNNPPWGNGSYFAITKTSQPEKFFRKERQTSFEIEELETFGTLTAYKLKLTDKGIEEAAKKEKSFLRGKEMLEPEVVKNRCLRDPKPSCRFTWGDVINQ